MHFHRVLHQVCVQCRSAIAFVVTRRSGERTRYFLLSLSLSLFEVVVIGRYLLRRLKASSNRTGDVVYIYVFQFRYSPQRTPSAAGRNELQK